MWKKKYIKGRNILYCLPDSVNKQLLSHDQKPIIKVIIIESFWQLTNLLSLKYWQTNN